MRVYNGRERFRERSVGGFRVSVARHAVKGGKGNVGVRREKMD